MKIRRSILLILSALWVIATGSGFGVLWTYGSTPGATAHSPPSWPTDSGIKHEPGHSVLLMFVHPRCPCTRASAGELAWIMARVPDRVSAYVVFVRPSGAGPGWEKDDLWESVAAIPGVWALRDEDGHEARRFGAVTSGQTFLYDEAGRLSFCGGITSGRGHAGDNLGRASIIAMLNNQDHIASEAPTYGCRLFNEACENCKVTK